MSGVMLGGIKEAALRYPLIENVKYSYGTAGFRCKADLLQPVAYRMGLLSALRAKTVKCCVGMMVTASHNPAPDNGLKVVEPLGEMLVEEWEEYATQLSNTPSHSLAEVFLELARKIGTDISSTEGMIVIGRDTRLSGPEIAAAVTAGAESLKCYVRDIGVCTTPQVHWIVKQSNLSLPNSMSDYYTNFATSFRNLYRKPSTIKTIKVDCANGVGACALAALSPLISQLINIQICNDGTTGELNSNCGADYVKLTQAAPNGVSNSEGEHCYSIDGDADRSLFFYKQDDKFVMLDGDKIACLYACFINDLICSAGLSLSIGVVQTAYANGSSTAYLAAKGIPTACVPTGVKHLHQKAEDYDVGVYFEANGHGTVLFSDQAMSSIAAAAENSASEAADRLCSFTKLINTAVGDAVTNILAIETILELRSMTAAAWDSIYQDLPYRQLKVAVRDREVIKTRDAERQVSAPAGLQDKIDALVTGEGRCFVRPSGTENCVRVHAECSTQDRADSLASDVAQMVLQFTESLYSKL